MFSHSEGTHGETGNKRTALFLLPLHLQDLLQLPLFQAGNVRLINQMWPISEVFSPRGSFYHSASVSQAHCSVWAVCELFLILQCVLS